MRNVLEVRAARIVAAAMAAGFWIAAEICAASTPSATDCAEGAEFIGNAARARDTGTTREAFLDRMQSDFIAIRSLPNELRWFAHDEADEAFLLGAAREIFDRPEGPDLHRIGFFRACMSRLTA
jgi:hypothetical protein